MRLINKKWYLCLLILAVSGAYIYFASYSTSPLYPYYYGGDSAQFQTMGKAWAMGKIPYRDMFDHKGPYIYFVDMLGFRLTGTSGGIAILQMINIFVLLIGIFKISQLATKNNSYALFSIFIILGILSLSYNHGNMTEEYCLPFIVFSTYFQVKYLMGNSKENAVVTHCPACAFFYGISFSICILTRATNGITIGVLLISIILLKDSTLQVFSF